MKFTVDGKTYDFDLDTLTMDEGEVIEDYARIEVRDFMDALKATKVRAIRALVFIAKRRAGEDVRWADLGSMDLMGLAQSMVADNAEPEPVAGEGAAAVASPDAAPVAKLRKATARKPKTVKAAEPEPAQAS